MQKKWDMTTKPTLSYVLTTYNKLPYLQEVMKRLLENVQPDEEIIVTDGASNDGTVEFLEKLYEQGKVQKFISEPDKGEAHGFNKAILMAEGELVKIITDDDIFNYSAIRKMKEYMLQNKGVEIITGNILSANITVEPVLVEFRKNYEVWFREWKNEQVSNCFFSGLPLMIRRLSFASIGLFSSVYKHLDLEFSVRSTSINTNIVFYTDIIALGIVNQKSISKKFVTDLEKTRIDLYERYGFIDKRGIKEQKTPWLRKKIINKIAIVRQQFNKRKWLTSKVELYPTYNTSEELDLEISKRTLTEIFYLLNEYLIEKRGEKDDFTFIKKGDA